VEKVIPRAVLLCPLEGAALFTGLLVSKEHAPHPRSGYADHWTKIKKMAVRDGTGFLPLSLSLCS
jgi:hypothetical protein